MWRFSLVLLACLVLNLGSSSELPCDPPCGVNGECMADHGQLYCRCGPNWSGDICTEFVCDGAANPCQQGGTCLVDPENSTNYLCVCPPDVLGRDCEYRPINDASCSSNACNGHGICYESASGGTECMCEEGRYGSNCQFPGEDPCMTPEVNGCHGHGMCTHVQVGEEIRHNCSCEAGYVTETSCKLFNPTQSICFLMPCQNEGMCIGNLTSYECECPARHIGKNCTEVFDVCEGACLNGGSCTEIEGGHYYNCSCPSGYSGYRCDVSEVCLNDGKSVRGPSGAATCVCPVGYSGPLCEHYDACATAPCSSNTLRCVSAPANTSALGYHCVCIQGWEGEHCNISVVGECPHADCEALAGNGHCDDMCDSYECGYDGSDCLSSDPWKNCPLPTSCRHHFLDGVCNVECNSAVCLYDGGECFPPTHPCGRVQECLSLTEDGQCAPVCNTLECPYDGADCSSDTESLADDILVVVLRAEPDQPFRSPWREEFLVNLSRLLNSVLVVLEVKELDRSELDPQGDYIVYSVKLKLDVSNCQERCPSDAEDAANIIEAAIASGHSSVGPYTVNSASSEPDGSEPVNVTSVVYGIVGSGVVLVVLAVLVVGVLIGRKRVFAKLWRPDSPSEGSPGEASGGVMSSGTARSSDAADAALAKDTEDYLSRCAKKAKMESSSQVMFEDVTDGHGAVIGQRGHDPRQWTLAHRADVGKLVHQYKQANGSTLNIDTPGPGGFTPLMLAVMRRPGTVSRLNYQSRSSSESSSDDQTALIPAAVHHTPRHNHILLPPVDRTVSALLESKANVDAVNDYNQTALHLAASCSRPEYVDQLVEAGANPNIPDNWGQTPLHAAIGAGAEGAFMVLLNCPRTKINVKSDGGITPLMAAVKLVNGFMVKQLLKKDAEIISSTDDDGRTAVHWAAMVDNIEALRMLVKCGSETIKDAQDNKGQTPLFLACREGSGMCVKHLLDCFANVTLLDSLEQSPLSIASQKNHTDIVDMLRASSHGPILMGPRNSYLPEVSGYPPATPHPLVTPPVSNKRKKKTATSNHYHQFRNQGQGSFQTAPHIPMSELQTSHAHSMAMSELPSSTVSQATPTTSFTHQQPSPPNYPPGPGPSHSPPLLTPHCQQLYTPTSNPAHYSIATPTTSSGYSPSSHDHHQLMGEDTQATVSSSLQHSSAVLDNYPVYPHSEDIGGPGTRPLQHLPVGNDADIQTSFGSSHHTMAEYVQTQGGAGSPPQSGGSVSQRSPPSAFQPGPSPNSTSYGASPQSLTPSPESQHPTIAMGTVLPVHGTVQVEPSYGYHHHHTMHHHHFMGSTQV